MVHLLCKKGRADCLQKAADKKLRVDWLGKDIFGEDPLHMACSLGRLDCVLVLSSMVGFFSFFLSFFSLSFFLSFSPSPSQLLFSEKRSERKDR